MGLRSSIARRPARQGARRGEGAGLDDRRHENRLEEDLRVRLAAHTRPNGGQPMRALVTILITAAVIAFAGSPADAQAKKPNILVIFGDDIGIPQISAYTMGLMGYRT